MVIFQEKNSHMSPFFYTEVAGLQFFNRAAVKANRYWYYASALRPMRGNQYFRCHLVNIGPNYKK